VDELGGARWSGVAVVFPMLCRSHCPEFGWFRPACGLAARPILS